jgi:NTP pyrophosphatase (non-canonical NTP hydrolase)
MKLEVGKRYLTRDGRATTPLREHAHEDFPFIAEMEPHGAECWTADGRYFSDSPNTYPEDLVAELPELQLATIPVVVAGPEGIASSGCDFVVEHPGGSVLVEAVEPRVSSSFVPGYAVTINELAAEIHANNAHFYHNPATGAKLDRNPGEMIALIHSEVSEMLEGVRKGLQDDHLPHRRMEEVEAADIFIRLLDYCAYRGIDLGGAVAEKREYNRTRQDHTNAARLAAGGKKF